MGASPSTALSDIFIFTYEYKMLKRVIALGNRKQIKMISYMVRMIDDILFVFADNENTEIIEDLYPVYIQLDPNIKSTKVQYLNKKIFKSRKRVNTSGSNYLI